MVIVVSKESEKERINNIFLNLEKITKDLFPDCEIRPIPLSNPTSDFYTRAVYTQPCIRISAFEASEVIVRLGPGPPSLSIIDKRTYEDASKLAHAYESHLNREFHLHTP